MIVPVWVPRAACPLVLSNVFWIALAGNLPVAPLFNMVAKAIEII